MIGTQMSEFDREVSLCRSSWRRVCTLGMMTVEKAGEAKI